MALAEDIAEACEEIITVNEGRASFYRMLSSLFYREVTQEKIGELLAINWNGLYADDNAEGGEDLLEGLRLMTGSLMRADGRTRQALASDYAHTFLAAGTYKESRAVPYESVYTSEDGLLMQDARDDVYRLFCQEHLGTDDSEHEPEDHISFECEFMATMADRLNGALRQRDWSEAVRLASVAFVFHSTHLANWIDDFAAAIEACAQTDFYRGLSKVAQAFIKDDATSLTDISTSVNAMARACGVE
ncbi:MAG: molecular chaperone TorD family protein [Eggerthellaceae bacterium]|nr:molecular chaperone TorD family protein [Eggerthellaceae bacterium]